MTKKFFVIILCMLLVLPLMVSCDATGTDVSKEELSGSGDTSDECPLVLPDGKKFDHTIKILCLPSSRHTYAEMQFVPNEDSSGNVINDAVQERNNIIESNYGIRIEIVTDTDPYSTLDLSIAGGLDEYQLICDTVNKLLPNAGRNRFLSLNDDVMIEQDYWDKSAIDTLRVDENVYFLAGDAIICDDEFSYCVIFNKDLYNDNPDCSAKYGDIYKLVRDGKWTYDAMYAMAKSVTQPDDDGNYRTADCTYGILTEGYAAEMMVAGSGNTSFVRTAEGGFRFDMDSQSSLTSFNKVFDIVTDQTASIMVDHFQTDGWKTISDMFTGNKGLFYTTAVSSVSTLEGVNFGVIPMPKTSEGQDGYFSGINIYQTEVLAVPSRNTEGNHDATMFLLDALGYWSKHTPGQYTVTEAYYDTTLKLQKLDTDDDEQMLDIICNNRLYDIGYIYNWGGVLNIWAGIIRGGQNTGASTVDGRRDEAIAAMEATLQDYADIVS